MSKAAKFLVRVLLAVSLPLMGSMLALTLALFIILTLPLLTVGVSVVIMLPAGKGPGVIWRTAKGEDVPLK